MSLEIKTRNAAQCRSHHQKLIGKVGDVEDLLKVSRDYVMLHSL